MKQTKPANYWKDWKNLKLELEKIISEYGCLPSGKRLCRDGKSSIARAIHKHGGFQNVRQKLGFNLMKKPSKYWSQWKNVKKELEKIIEDLGHFPSTNEMANYGVSTLGMAINNFGGVNTVRKKLGYEPIEHIIENYKEWESVEETLRPIMEEIGEFPSASILRARGLGQLVTALYNYHGGINAARKKLGNEIETCHYMNESGLQKGLEKMWKDYPELNNEIPPDNWMREHGLSVLGYAIVKYHGGFRKLREKLGKKQRHKYKRGYLDNWNNVAAELIKIHAKYPELNGELPSLNWLITHGYSTLGEKIIEKHGGFPAIRERFGGEQKRVENGYYENFENIKTEIEKLREQLGHFPSTEDMKKTNNKKLYYGIIRYHNGMTSVRKKLGEDLKIKRNGYWKNWDNVKNELLPLIAEYGYLPGGWTLNKIGKKSLVRAISHYHGGMTKIRERMQEYIPVRSEQNLKQFLEDYVGGDNYE